MGNNETREQLNALLAEHVNYWDHDHQKAVDAMRAAGWRPPARVIKSVDELDALPICAIVRWGHHVDQCIGDGWFFPAGSENPVSSEALFEAAEGVSEITVLYVPEEAGQ